MIRWRCLVGFALGLLLCITSPLLSAHKAEGYLFIRRAANFGNAQWLELLIDGAKVDPVAYGHDFQTPIPVGHHVIAFRPSNTRWEKRFNRMDINIVAGQTYEFVAFRENDWVFLHPVN